MIIRVARYDDDNQKSLHQLPEQLPLLDYRQVDRVFRGRAGHRRPVYQFWVRFCNFLVTIYSLISSAYRLGQKLFPFHRLVNHRDVE